MIIIIVRMYAHTRMHARKYMTYQLCVYV